MEGGNGKQDILWKWWQFSIAYDIGLYWAAPPNPQESVLTKDARLVMSTKFSQHDRSTIIISLAHGASLVSFVHLSSPVTWVN